MRVTIKGLRRYVLGAAGLLLAVVAGFFMYGRYRFRRIERDLPGRLGINIQQTATGWSYSQSSQGHTLFTLKASKESQLKSGHVLLHDVDITLYGPPGSKRQDRISGSDFEYDTNSGVATSQGDVTIELSGVTGSATTVSGGNGDAGSNTIRVRTSGLTFAQKTGEASTAQAVEFQLPRGAGSSLGAHYNAKTGVLELKSDVKITTSSNGESAVVQAAHAMLVRESMQAFLTDASMEYEEEVGSADEATVNFRDDGTAEKIDAQGHVRMKTDTGATVESGTAAIAMDTRSQPTTAELGAGVQFDSAHDNATMHGTSAEGTLQFGSVRGVDGRTQTGLRHAEFRQDVQFAEKVAGLAKDPHGRAEKHLQGQKVDVDFAPSAPEGGVEAHKAVAEGNPAMTLEQIPSKGPAQTTRISGDRLVAVLGAGNALQQLDGAGHTRIDSESADGSKDTSQGDVLHATFTQQAAAKKTGATGKPGKTRGENAHRKGASAAESGMETALETAIQDGNVVLTETPALRSGAAKKGAEGSCNGVPALPAMLIACAQHAEYHAANQVLVLMGSPSIRSAGADGSETEMAAKEIDYHRDTQDADGKGAVKATYTAPPKPGAAVSGPGFGGGSGPVHVIAERAALHHASNASDFYGTGEKPARLWQEADSLTAPVIEIDRTKNVLQAWEAGAGSKAPVQANFTSAMGARHQLGVARVSSQTFVYRDEARQAEFRGNVTMDQGGAAIHADDGLVFLKPAQAGARKPGAPAEAAGGATQSSSQIDRLIATGHVVFTQPGRRGDGEKLVYTADDGQYVLTGTPEALPRLSDSVHGTTTGTALLFNSQDDSVEVGGGKSSAITNTRAPR
jgi:lipopolysaccharide export system protein LptA